MLRPPAFTTATPVRSLTSEETKLKSLLREDNDDSLFQHLFFFDH